MEDTAKKFCSILFDVLEQKGVTDIVCSPGSRNVPLLIAAASRESLKKHFIIDERSAAFVGLGISLISKKPVALICTSGTALLNYAPAIAEAYYQSIPLIVISADRPVEWIDQDDSQTLRQDGALANYVKKSYSIPSIGEDISEMQWYVNRIANDAIIEAMSRRKGPVHINIHLSEPLGYKVNRQLKTTRIIHNIIGDAIGNKETVRDLSSVLASSKVMLVAGFNQPDSILQKNIVEFSRFDNVIVMAETISNLHLEEYNYSVDSVLTSYDEETLDSLAPDIVISIGGALVSRKLKEYLRRNAGKCQHWSVGYAHTTTDPFMSLSLRIETEPTRFFRNINKSLKKIKLAEPVISYRKDWIEKKRLASIAKNKFINGSPWSELKIFEMILKNIPTGNNLFLSNGTAIRYAQIIQYPLPHASYCNRGVSGIDGSLSTAVGGAIEYKGNTILIIGDLSMAYDIGALGLNDVPDRFKVIVIDNQGGGIFRFISSTSSLQEREQYLCMQPDLPLKNLAEGYGWEYFEADSEKQLSENLQKLISCHRKAILNVRADGVKSAEILKDYMFVKIDKA